MEVTEPRLVQSLERVPRSQLDSLGEQGHVESDVGVRHSERQGRVALILE